MRNISRQDKVIQYYINQLEKIIVDHVYPSDLEALSYQQKTVQRLRRKYDTTDKRRPQD